MSYRKSVYTENQAGRLFTVRNAVCNRNCISAILDRLENFSNSKTEPLIEWGGELSFDARIILLYTRVKQRAKVVCNNH